jgi:Major Facilitator Superfamily
VALGVFLVNVPVGVAGLVLAPLLLAESRDPAASRRLDLLGAVTVTAGLVMLLYGLTRIQDAGLASPATIGPLASAAVLLTGYLAVERRVSNPLTPLGVFRSHDLVAANLVAFTLTAATSPPGVLLTVYLQVVLGLSPTATGLSYLPSSLSVVAGSFVGSWLSSSAGVKATMALGTAAVVAGMLLISGISVEGGLAFLVPGLALSGLGLGCASVASTATGTAAVGAEDQGLASGLLNTAAQLGTAMGIAGLVTIAAVRSAALAGGDDPAAAELVAGFRLALLAAAAIAAAGCLVALLLVRGARHR